MSRLTGLRQRLAGLMNRSREELETEEEIRFHLEKEVERNVAEGMAPEEAWRRAAIAFGGRARVREEVRDERGVKWVEEWAADVRYALRTLRSSRGFASVAVLTVALGVGANTAMFSVVDNILVRPLPYPEAGELVLLHQSNPRTGEVLGRVSLEDMEDWRARVRSLKEIAGFAPVASILSGRGDPLEVEVTYVTERFFEVLGVPAALGRPLLEEDHRQRERSAVVSDRMWRTALGGDVGAIGSTIVLRGEPFTVVGVMPPRVQHPTPETGVWIPRSLVPPNFFSNGLPGRGDRYLRAIGRLAPGSTPSEAQRELSGISAELAEHHPGSNEDWTAATVVGLHRSLTGDVSGALLVVLGVVGFILLIGCANLANLLLARGSARGRELAVRAALGASRGRIVRQLLTESLVLAVIGGIAGIVLAVAGVQAVLALSADTLPRVEDVRLDLRVIAFGLLLSGATGLVFGLAPALRVSGSEPQRDLRGGRGTVGAEGRRLRGALVVAEVALAVLLVIGAGLMARSFLSLRSVDPGFRPEGVLAVELQIDFSGVPEEEISGFLVQRREEILERVRALPGVESVGMTNVFPLRPEIAFAYEYTPAGAEARPDAPRVQAETRYVDPGYLGTMEVPLLRGDPLPTQLASDGPRPVLLSESAARRLWPDADPLGRMLAVPWGQAVVVGIVGDVRQIGLADAPVPAVYFPQLMAPRIMATLVVRSAGDPRALAGPIRSAIHEVSPNQPIRGIHPMTEVLGDSIARDRFFTLLFGIFGGLALVLAAVGVYGVLAYTVRQRTAEIGVRIALGARSVEVLRNAVITGMKPVWAGIVIGTAAALALGRLIESQLYAVPPTDPLAFAGAIGLLTIVAALASYLPARRATKVSPITALRAE